VTAKLIKLKRPRQNRSQRLLSEIAGIGKDLKGVVVITGHKRGEWQVSATGLKGVELGMVALAMHQFINEQLQQFTKDDE
jgi:hypothetical protein